MNRLGCIATETFKCTNNVSPVYHRGLAEVKQSKYYFRYDNTAKIPTVRTDDTYGYISLRFESAHVWYSLSSELRTATSFREFKCLMSTLVGPRCNWTMCGVCDGQVSKK